MHKDIFIRDMPIELQEAIKENYKKQHLTFDTNVNLAEAVSRGGFYWGNSHEGHEFWRGIFYKEDMTSHPAYPKKKETINLFKFC